MKVLAIVSAILIISFFPLLMLSTRTDIIPKNSFMGIVAIIYFILLFVSFIYLLTYFFILIPRKKRQKQEEAESVLKQDKKTKLLEKVKEINEMLIKDLLEQNEMGQYCENFESNKVYTIDTAIKLNDNDLINIGISILGDRIKILSLIEKKRAMLNRADVLLKNIDQGGEIRINKFLFIWVGTFLLGGIGMDRFMRGQIGMGILKLLTVGLGGLWIIAARQTHEYLCSLETSGKTDFFLKKPCSKTLKHREKSDFGTFNTILHIFGPSSEVL